MNYYGGEGRDLTPYHMKVEDNVIHELTADLEQMVDYAARREAVRAFNEQNSILKKGLALTPVKFGISFNATHLNQAGALGACLQGWIGSSQPRWYGNGPGPVRQSGAGGCRRVPDRH